MNKKALTILPLLFLLTLTSCDNSNSLSSKNSQSTSNSISTSTTISYYSVTVNIIGQGSVTGYEGTFEDGSQVTLSASADDGYTFEGYFIDEENVCKELTYSFIINKDVAVTAKFNEQIKEDEDKDYVYQTFSHKFLQSDFNDTLDGYATKEGTKEINGLTWDYDKFTFLGQSSNGIQIGSKKAPQKTPWHLKATLDEEVIITSLSISGVNSTGTNFILTGSEKEIINETLTNSEYQMYTFEELDANTNIIDISLSTTAKSFYLDYITITCKVDKNSSLVLASDEQNATAAVPGQGGVPTTKYSSITKEEYYKDIDFEASQENLKSSLETLISNMDKYSYGDDTNIMLYTDANPENGANLYGVYDGDDIAAINSGIWNKEHVWPCSQMGLGGENRPTSSTKNRSSDLHNLRVSCQSANGAHGNKFYDNVSENSSSFFPNITGTANMSHNYSGDHRGDVARILFYMEVRYASEGLHLDDLLNGSDDYSMGKLETLLEWNKLDPVDEFEIQRNNRIYEYQGNRNSFIDYPDLANKLYA